VTQEAAVIGAPVSHSRSPAIFSFLAKKLGRPELSYTAIEVQPAGLQDFLTGLRSKPGFAGVNVTIPHKEQLLRLLDDVSLEARAVGAVNVVQVEGGRLRGHNTDVLGIVRTLEEQGVRMAGEDAWIWGAGGAARAAAYALGSLGARCVYLQNRDSARAAKIQDELGAFFPGTSYVVVRPGAAAQAQPLSLLINATPLGMKGAAPAGTLFDSLRELPFRRGALAFDLIYNPERTPFLARAEEQGLRTVSGLDMLVHQALATWEIWFGPLGGPAQLREAKDALIAHLRERPIFLTGFMGVGKSVVGITLATRLGWEFLDTDELIVRKAGAPIPRIFESQGEAVFRELENAAISEAALRSRAVISLGGGALVNPANLAKVEQAGTLVYLEASAEYLQQRLSASATSRPLLAGLGDQERGEKIRAMLKERAPVYERASVRIGTDNMRPNDVVDGILRLLFSEPVFRQLARVKEGA
jgi:shikimate dehydrogenase